MADKTAVYRVVVVLEGNKNHNALVFKEPEAGYSYKEGELIAIEDGGTTSFRSNDEGVIPYREQTQGPDEDLGLTWHFAK